MNEVETGALAALNPYTRDEYDAGPLCDLDADCDGDGEPDYTPDPYDPGVEDYGRNAAPPRPYGDLVRDVRPRLASFSQACYTLAQQLGGPGYERVDVPSELVLLAISDLLDRNANYNALYERNERQRWSIAGMASTLAHRQTEMLYVLDGGALGGLEHETEWDWDWRNGLARLRRLVAPPPPPPPPAPPPDRAEPDEHDDPGPLPTAWERLGEDALDCGLENDK